MRVIVCADTTKNASLPVSSGSLNSMSVKVFIPQDMVDAWVTSERVELVGESLTFRASGITLRLVPGYLFVGISAGSDARHALLGRVKAKAAIAALGAEIYMNSVILGETAYDVEVGFVAKPLLGDCDYPTLVDAIRSAGV